MISTNQTIYQVSLPALFTKDANGELQAPPTDYENYLLPNELILHIFQFYKQIPGTLFPFLLTSKQWYVIAMTDPFIRFAQALAKVSQASDQECVQINSHSIWMTGSLMTKGEMKKLLKLDPTKKSLEKILRSNLQFFASAFKGYFHPLLHHVRWNPVYFEQSQDPEVKALACNHLNFHAARDLSSENWINRLKDRTIDLSGLYRGACNPEAPSHSLYDSTMNRVQALILHFPNPTDHRPLLLHLLNVQGKAYSQLTNHLKYDLEVLAAALAYEEEPSFISKENEVNFQTLRQLAKELAQVKKANGKEAFSPLLEKCVHAMAQLPSMQGIKEKNQLAEALEPCARRWSRLAVDCLKKLLPPYFEKTGSSFPLIVDNLKAYLLTKPYTTYKADLRRSVSEKYFHCTCNGESLETFHETGDQTVDAQLLRAHFKQMLTLFMRGLDLDPQSLECLAVLAYLEEDVKSPDAVFNQMEKLYHFLDASVQELKKSTNQHANEQTADSLSSILAGPLKLFPLLRGFNQSLLLEVHGRIFVLKRMLDVESRGLIVKPVTNLPDNQNKFIAFTFEEGKATLEVNRLGHLLNHPQCLIESQVRMSAPADRITKWTIEARVIITRPPNGDSQFEEDYADLISLLDLMELPYQEIA